MTNTGPHPHTDEQALVLAQKVMTELRSQMLETAGKGIIYEHQAACLPAQRLAAELRRGIVELSSKAGTHAARVEREAASALRRVERAARGASAAFPDAEDPKTAWMAFARRLLGPGSLAARDDEQSASSRSATPDAPRIIIP